MLKVILIICSIAKIICSDSHVFLCFFFLKCNIVLIVVLCLENRCYASVSLIKWFTQTDDLAFQ